MTPVANLRRSARYKREVVRDYSNKRVVLRYSHTLTLDCGHTTIIVTRTVIRPRKFCYCFQCYCKDAYGKELPSG